jgi:hypothetical protein
MNSVAVKPLLLRKLPVTRLQTIGVLLAVYLLSYAVLMNRRSPAITEGKGFHWVVFQSSFRFAPQADGYPAATFWNYLYYPLDKIYFGLFPSHRKYGDWKDVDHQVPF